MRMDTLIDQMSTIDPTQWGTNDMELHAGAGATLGSSVNISVAERTSVFAHYLPEGAQT